MSRLSSITDLIPVGSRGNPAAQKLRREDSGAGFDQVLNEAKRNKPLDKLPSDKHNGLPVQEGRDRDRHERYQERAERAESASRPESASRAESASRPEREDRRKVPGLHSDDQHAPDAGPSQHGDAASKTAAHKAEANASDPEQKKASGDKPVEAVSESPAMEGVGVLAAVPAPVLADVLLATQTATAEGQSIAGDAQAGTAQADTLLAVARQLSPQLAAQVAAPALVAAETEETKVADAVTKPPSTASAAVPTLSAGETLKSAVSGDAGAVDGKPAKTATAEKSENTQSTNITSARDFARALDLSQASPSASSGTVVAAPSPSPTAAAIADAAQTAKAATPAEAMARADAPVPLQAVAVEIGMRAMRGSKEFSIRLDPEDLGRIDVRLEISEAGQVQAKVVVERVETLQLLQRDAKTLERAFDQAGLKTSADGLQFSLRDPGQQNSGQQGRDDNQSGQQGRPNARNDNDADKALVDDITLRPALYRLNRNSGFDIRI